MKVNYPLILLSVFVGRLLVFGASLGDSFAVIGLAGLFGYSLFLQSKTKEPLNEKTLSEVESMKSIVAGLRMSKPPGR